MAADAAGAAVLSILLSLAATLSLVSPSLAMYCHSLPGPGIPPYPRNYSQCREYPHHEAALHFTFDPANSSLSLAFAATPPSSGGWVAWAINPTSTGMVGAQALMALKTSTGSVVAKTFNISSHHSVVESKLSFDVWDLSAHEASDGRMWLFASVKACRRSLNLVWQVGGVVNGTRPGIHQLAFANKNAKATLELGASSGTGRSPVVSPTPAPARANGVWRIGEGRNGAFNNNVSDSIGLDLIGRSILV